MVDLNVLLDAFEGPWPEELHKDAFRLHGRPGGGKRGLRDKDLAAPRRRCHPSRPVHHRPKVVGHAGLGVDLDNRRACCRRTQ